MHGNLWEWCQDRYGKYPRIEVTDPTGASAPARYRVLRGGCWSKDAEVSRSAWRYGHNPDLPINDLGIRVVCTVVKKTESTR